MAIIFKCKICGGSLDVIDNLSIAKCPYCGETQTLPRLDSERKANLYDRANHFRRNNDYDKAMSIYESVLNEDSTDAESYWSLVLCKYGIEYVEDPATHKRIPTVNRTQFTSIFADEDYKSAINYSDVYQRKLYESEAKAIDEIQKGILEISEKEEPFDVFISYKETDNQGQRTPDSVLATELYHELTREGLKVFFSRITLEDKLGTAYEPYIFAALNSSKVMVVLGTKPEYYNAVWVKNEWSRYLSLIKGGAKKTLIPAYRDMDPYDLPEEFSHLQALDMSKLGFMQDLIRGIQKIVIKEKSNNDELNSNVSMATPLIERAFMCLEDSEWNKADELLEQALNIEPKNAMAYLGKLLVELKVSSKENLANYKHQFDDSNNYKKIIRFGDDTLKAEIEKYAESAYSFAKLAKEKKLNETYLVNLEKMKKAITAEEFENIAKTFQSLYGYNDSKNKAKECLERAEWLNSNNGTVTILFKNKIREDDFSLKIDGRRFLYGRIDAQKTIKYDLSAGKHNMIVSGGTFFSDPLVFEIKREENTTIKISNTISKYKMNIV